MTIPKEKEFLITKSLWVNEIIDEYTKQQSVLIYWKTYNDSFEYKKKDVFYLI